MAVGVGKVQTMMYSVLMVVVLVVAVIQVITGTISTVFTNLGYLQTNFTAEGVPFADFFASGGVMSLVYGIVILIAILGAFFSMGGSLKSGR